MKHSDVEAIAREAELIEPSDVWADLPPIYTLSLSRLAALLLEKAAKEEMQPGIYTKHDLAERIRQMAAGMGE